MRQAHLPVGAAILGDHPKNLARDDIGQFNDVAAGRTDEARQAAMQGGRPGSRIGVHGQLCAGRVIGHVADDRLQCFAHIGGVAGGQRDRTEHRNILIAPETKADIGQPQRLGGAVEQRGRGAERNHRVGP